MTTKLGYALLALGILGFVIGIGMSVVGPMAVSQNCRGLGYYGQDCAGSQGIGEAAPTVMVAGLVGVLLGVGLIVNGSHIKARQQAAQSPAAALPMPAPAPTAVPVAVVAPSPAPLMPTPGPSLFPPPPPSAEPAGAPAAAFLPAPPVASTSTPIPKFCYSCGAPLRGVFCGSCGTKNA